MKTSMNNKENIFLKFLFNEKIYNPKILILVLLFIFSIIFITLYNIHVSNFVSQPISSPAIPRESICIRRFDYRTNQYYKQCPSRSRTDEMHHIDNSDYRPY